MTDTNKLTLEEALRVALNHGDICASLLKVVADYETTPETTAIAMLQEAKSFDNAMKFILEQHPSCDPYSKELSAQEYRDARPFIREFE